MIYLHHFDSDLVSKMELRQLRYFIAVAEEENFRRAAERLNVVQPALSRQVRQLETELGARLLERLGRGVRLTAAGQALLHEGRELLRTVEAISGRVRAVGHGIAGRLAVGFSDSATYSGRFPDILREFRQRFPGIQLDLFPENSLGQQELLRQRTIQIGFSYLVPTHIESVGSKRIGTERIMVAMVNTHRLAGKRSIRLKDLVGEPFVWFPRSINPVYYDGVLAACQRAGLCLRVVQEGNNDTNILSLVSAGIGITFTIESAKWRLPYNVVLLPIEDWDLSVCLHAIWRTDDTSPALSQFLKVVDLVLKNPPRNK
jgi:DNA-binding transcriptional LysR family regulator